MTERQFDSYLTIAIILTAALGILRATGIIGCSWLWVFAPLWVPSAIITFMVILALAIRCIKGDRNKEEEA